MLSLVMVTIGDSTGSRVGECVMDDAMREAWDILFTRWETEFSDEEGDALSEWADIYDGVED